MDEDERAKRLARLKQWKHRPAKDHQTQANGVKEHSVAFSLGKRSRGRPVRLLPETDTQPPLPAIAAEPEAIVDTMGETSGEDPLNLYMDTLDATDPQEHTELQDQDDEPDIQLQKPEKKRSKRQKEIPFIDHSKREYRPFERVFYRGENPTRDLEGNISVSQALDPLKSWEQGGFTQQIIDEIRAKDYSTPTPIQAVAGAAILGGKDVLAVAETGSGKTMAFVLPMLRHVQAQNFVDGQDGPIAIVLSPTRELCGQIYNEVLPLANVAGIDVCCSYGGSNSKQQIDQLATKSVQIIVATPGRLIDLLAVNKGRILSTLMVSFLVIDEADRMFDMGFSPQLYRIFGTLRKDRQTVLCSATFSPSMQELARKVLNDPVYIEIGQSSTKVGSHIKQELLLVDSASAKLETLTKYLEKIHPPHQSIVFVERQEIADDLASQLLRAGFKCTSLHGGKSQEDRDGSIEDLRNGELDLIVATSIAARGLDVRTVRLVVNFDPPNHLEDYIHRVGRTGRAGDPGLAVTLFSAGQYKQAHEICKVVDEAPAAILQLASQFKDKIYSREGFTGKGLERLQDSRAQLKSQQSELMNEESSLPVAKITQADGVFQATLEFNDFPQQARKSITSLGKQTRIIDEHHVSLTMKGQYNKIGDKLRLLIEGGSKQQVQSAYEEFAGLLSSSMDDIRQSSSRYTI